MRKVALFAAVVCFIFGYSLNAVGQYVPHFIGLSAGATDGAHEGQAGMNQACLNTYTNNPAAHMCTVEEFYRTAGIAANGLLVANGVQVWIQPAVSNCAYNGMEVLCQEAGSSALVPPTNLFFTCDSWTSNLESIVGTSVLFGTGTGGGGVLQTDTCNNKHRVACCNP